MTYRLNVIFRGLCGVVPNGDKHTVLLVNALEAKEPIPGLKISAHRPCLIFRTSQVVPTRQPSPPSPRIEQLPRGKRAYSMISLDTERVELTFNEDDFATSVPAGATPIMEMDTIERRFGKFGDWTADVEPNLLKSHPGSAIWARARFTKGGFSGISPSCYRWEQVPFSAQGVSQPPEYAKPALESALQYKALKKETVVTISATKIDKGDDPKAWSLLLQLNKETDVAVWIANLEDKALFTEAPEGCQDPPVIGTSISYQAWDADFAALYDLCRKPPNWRWRAIPYTRDIIDDEAMSNGRRSTRRKCMHALFNSSQDA